MQTLVRTFMAILAVVVSSAPGPARAQDAPPDTVVQAALNAASGELGVPADNLIVVMAAQRDWPDASLGCPEPGKAYAQVITPGWAVTIDTDDLSTELQVNTDSGSRAAIC